MAMTRGPLVVGVTLASLVALPGCAGKFKLSSKTMCEAHGGTYSPATQQCTYTQTPRTAKQICEAHDGIYVEGAQFCEFPGPGL